MKKLILTLIPIVLLSGCAAVRGWEPINNDRADKNASSFVADKEYCKGKTEEALNWTYSVTQDTLTGGGFGAAEGAVIGAFGLGSATAGLGAAAGAGIGSIIGLYYGEYEKDESFKRIYSTCLRQLGHYPID